MAFYPDETHLLIQGHRSVSHTAQDTDYTIINKHMRLYSTQVLKEHLKYSNVQKFGVFLKDVSSAHQDCIYFIKS